MATYPLSIITPNGKLFEDQAEFLTAPGVEGSLGVLANHAPMIVALARGIIKVKGANFEQFYALNSGVLEVNAEHAVLILADIAEKADSFEEAKSAANKLVDVVTLKKT